MQAQRLIFQVILESVQLTILTTTMLTLNVDVNLYFKIKMQVELLDLRVYLK